MEGVDVMPELKRTPSGGYGQDWPAYRAAQVNEEPYFHQFLRELCYEVEEPEHDKGRTPIPLRDVIYSLVYKVYVGRSAQRFRHMLREAHLKGFIRKIPSSNTLLEYMREASLTLILYHLVVKSSLPLAEVENIFAVDSTGLAAPRRRTFFNRHKKRWEKKRDHVKLHVMCGVRTNVITCAEVTEGTASDRNYFKPLVERTARYFEISEVSADAGYVNSENSRTVLLLDGTPYIAFYKTCALDADYKSQAWKDALYLWKTRNPEFMKRYYMRNNVEATFSSLKRKFGDKLSSKSDRGLINEALCKVLCHNICVLIQSMYELGIDPTSWANAKLTSKAEADSIGVALTNSEKSLVESRIPAATVKRPSRLSLADTGEAINQAEKQGNSGPKVKRKKAHNENQFLLFEK
jgi:Transposase DDE domain